jgi:adenylate cyclase
MTSERAGEKGMTSDQWRKVLTEGEPAMRALRRVFRSLPSSPRCGMCLSPFRGIGGKVLGVTGFGPSRKNPRFCNRCFEEAPHGGAEVDTGILFADIRGYTAFSESHSPEEVRQLLNRFYIVATDALASRNAVIDKLVGDQVMALFVPGFAGQDYIGRMIESAETLLRGVGYGQSGEPWLQLGVGLDQGNAFVGNVGAGDVKDFTAIGDVVNTASRLQAEAQPGQIVMSEHVYEQAAERYPNARAVELQLKGRNEPVRARVIDVAA